MKKDYSKDDILRIFQSAPAEVRETLTSPELAELISDIAKRNSLPSDKMVKIAEYNRNLLLGLTSPAEVLGNLIFAGIHAENAQKILEELNQKVFIPTHKKMLDKKQGQNNISAIPRNDNTKKDILKEYIKPAHISDSTKHEGIKMNDAPDKIQSEQSEDDAVKTEQKNQPSTTKEPVEKHSAQNHSADPYRESFQ